MVMCWCWNARQAFIDIMHKHATTAPVTKKNPADPSDSNAPCFRRFILRRGIILQSVGCRAAGLDLDWVCIVLYFVLYCI